jgi:hypothetical protein
MLGVGIETTSLQPLSTLPIVAMLYVLSVAGFTLAEAEKLYIFGCMAISGIAGHQFGVYFSRRRYLGLLTGVFYMLNPVVYSRFPAQFYLFLGYAVFPLAVLFFIKSFADQSLKSVEDVSRRTIRWPLYRDLAASSILTSAVFWSFYIFGILLTLVEMLIVTYSLLGPEIRLRSWISTCLSKVSLFAVHMLIVISLNLFWFLPFLPNLLGSGTNPVNWVPGVTDFEYWSNNSISSVIRLLTFYSRGPGLLASTLLFVFPISVGTALLIERRKTIFLALVFLLSVILGSGPTPPFGSLNIYLYQHVPFYPIFRDSTEFYYLIVLCYCCVVAIIAHASVAKISNIIHNKTSRISKMAPALFVIAILSFSVGAVAFHSASFLSNDMRTIDISPYFLAADNFLAKQPGDFRVLWVPEVYNAYVRYTWSTSSMTDIARAWGTKPAVQLVISLSPTSVDMVYLMLQWLYGQRAPPSGLARVLAMMGIRYVVLHNDIVSPFFPIPSLRANLTQTEGLTPVYRNPNYQIWEDEYATTPPVYLGDNLIEANGGFDSLLWLNSLDSFDSSTSVVDLMTQNSATVNYAMLNHTSSLLEYGNGASSLVPFIANPSYQITSFYGLSTGDDFGWTTASSPLDWHYAFPTGNYVITPSPLYFTVRSSSVMSSSFTAESGVYIPFVYLLRSPTGGAVKISIGSKTWPLTTKTSSGSTFDWIQLPNIHMDSGTYSVSITSMWGANAVSRIAFFSAFEMDHAFNQIQAAIKNSQIVYAVDGETLAPSSNSVAYAPTWSLGAAMIMNDPSTGTLWSFQNIKPARYSIFAHAAIYGNGFLTVTVGNETFTFKGENSGAKTIDLGEVNLPTGTQDIRIAGQESLLDWVALSSIPSKSDGNISGPIVMWNGTVSPPLGYTESTPEQYILDLPQSPQAENSVIVFADSFATPWVLNSTSSIHFVADGFANGWYSVSKDSHIRMSYTRQTLFVVGTWISAGTIFVVASLLVYASSFPGVSGMVRKRKSLRL